MPASGSPTSTRLEPGSPPPQRRRRGPVVALVSAAVVLAVAVPLTLRAGDLFGSDDEPTPAPVTATPSPAAQEGHQPPAGVLDVSDLPTGATPDMAYVADGVLHQADGGSVDVGTRHPVHAFVVLDDGSRVWQTSEGGTSYVETEEADGTFGDPVRSEFGLGVNPAHTVAAWVTPAGQVMVWSGDAAPTALGDPVTAGQDLRIGAVSGDDCSVDCRVIVNAADFRTGPGWQPWEVSVNGTEPLRDGGFLLVNDLSDAGLTIGYRKLDDFGSCSALLGGGEFEGFSTCKHTLASFSPDGQSILADPAYHDGIGNGVIAMYDLDGHRLFERHSTERAQSFYPAAQWEDATHVLAPVFQDGRWTVVRIASDGSMEYAVEPVAGKDVRNPFVLPTGGAS
jgi:hypothetical protein